jgi:hypothetical protein
MVKLITYPGVVLNINTLLGSEIYSPTQKISTVTCRLQQVFCVIYVDIMISARNQHMSVTTGFAYKCYPKATIKTGNSFMKSTKKRVVLDK